jgi:hypothetical protein
MTTISFTSAAMAALIFLLLNLGASLAVGSSLPPANRPFFIQLYSLEVGNSS